MRRSQICACHVSRSSQTSFSQFLDSTSLWCENFMAKKSHPAAAKQIFLGLVDSPHNCYALAGLQRSRYARSRQLGLQTKVRNNCKMHYHFSKIVIKTYFTYQSQAQEKLTKFYRKFKKVQIQEGHLYWHTMDPYHTNIDRFREIFFDYLPNCEPLIGPLVRPWHPFEFRQSAGVLPCSESKTRCK